MANIPQRDPESGASDQAGYTPTSGDAREYADTDRFGKTQKGQTSPVAYAVNPINKVSDLVWGVNAPSGGKNPPLPPDIPVAKGE
jgi:hypothetical protein